MRTWLHLAPASRRSRVVQLMTAPDGDVYVEIVHRGGPSVVWRAGAAGVATRCATLDGANRGGSLIAVEDDGLVCWFGDDVAVVTPDGARHLVTTLVPSPVAVAVCPEYVVWCCDRSVWRWWRDGRRPPQHLGDHGWMHPRPMHFAIRPSRRDEARIAPDVAVSAGTRLGIIDADELRWLATAPREIERISCTAGGIGYATQGGVYHCDLDADTTRQVAKIDATPSGLTMWDEDLALFHGQGVLFSANVRTARLHAVEPSHLFDRRHAYRHVAVAHGRIYAAQSDDHITGVWSRPAPGGPDPTSHLAVELFRFGADGTGAHVVVGPDGAWRTHGAGGTLPDEAMRAVMQWAVAHAGLRNSGPRPEPGCAVVIANGTQGWRMQLGDQGPLADAIAGLVRLLAPHVPAVASMC